MKLRVVGSLEAELEARVAELTAQLAAAEISRSSEEEQMGTGSFGRLQVFEAPRLLKRMSCIICHLHVSAIFCVCM